MILFIGLQRCDRYPSNVSSFDGEIQVFPYPKRWRGIISIYHSFQFNHLTIFYFIQELTEWDSLTYKDTFTHLIAITLRFIFSL